MMTCILPISIAKKILNPVYFILPHSALPCIGVWRRRKDIFTNHDLINHEGVYRTAPAAQGLLTRRGSPVSRQPSQMKLHH